MEEVRKEHAVLQGMLAELNAAFFPAPAAIKAAVAQTEKLIGMLIEEVANGKG